MFAVPKSTSLAALLIAGLVSFATSAWLEALEAPMASERSIVSARAAPQVAQYRQASLQRSYYLMASQTR